MERGRDASIVSLKLNVSMMIVDASSSARTNGMCPFHYVLQLLCQNKYLERMQRKEYADIEIVLTEKKGFGLRAGSDLEKYGCSSCFLYSTDGFPVEMHSSMSILVMLSANRRLSSE